MMTAEHEIDSWLAASGVALSREQWGKIDSYLADLDQYNKKTNVTADEGEALISRHVADGLAAVPVIRSLDTTGCPRVLDLGAGGGFIGFAVKIAWPEAEVTLLETAYRKFQFLSWEATRLGHKNLHVRWRPNAETYDFVLARAVAPLPDVLSIVKKHVKTNTGYFIAHQSERPDETTPGLQSALKKHSARLTQIVSYRLPRESSDRYLAAFQFDSGGS